MLELAGQCASPRKCAHNFPPESRLFLCPLQASTAINPALANEPHRFEFGQWPLQLI
jgi:hypothetical protein